MTKEVTSDDAQLHASRRGCPSVRRRNVNEYSTLRRSRNERYKASCVSFQTVTQPLSKYT